MWQGNEMEVCKFENLQAKVFLITHWKLGETCNIRCSNFTVLIIRVWSVNRWMWNHNRPLLILKVDNVIEDSTDPHAYFTLLAFTTSGCESRGYVRVFQFRSCTSSSFECSRLWGMRLSIDACNSFEDLWPILFREVERSRNKVQIDIQSVRLWYDQGIVSSADLHLNIWNVGDDNLPPEPFFLWFGTALWLWFIWNIYVFKIGAGLVLQSGTDIPH